MPTHYPQLGHAPPHPTPRPTTTLGADGPKIPQDRNELYIDGGSVGLGAIWYYYAMRVNEHIANRQEGCNSVLGSEHHKLTSVRAGSERNGTRRIDRNARRSLSRVAMKNSVILEQKLRRRCNLQEIKLASASSVGHSIPKEG